MPAILMLWFGLFPSCHITFVLKIDTQRSKSAKVLTLPQPYSLKDNVKLKVHILIAYRFKVIADDDLELRGLMANGHLLIRNNEKH